MHFYEKLGGGKQSAFVFTQESKASFQTDSNTFRLHCEQRVSHLHGWCAGLVQDSSPCSLPTALGSGREAGLEAASSMMGALSPELEKVPCLILFL